MPEVSCQQCGKVFHRTPSKHKIRYKEFCCPEHYFEYKRTTSFYNDLDEKRKQERISNFKCISHVTQSSPAAKSRKRSYPKTPNKNCHICGQPTWGQICRKCFSNNKTTARRLLRSNRKFV